MIIRLHLVLIPMVPITAYVGRNTTIFPTRITNVKTGVNTKKDAGIPVKMVGNVDLKKRPVSK